MYLPLPPVYLNRSQRDELDNPDPPSHRCKSLRPKKSDLRAPKIAAKPFGACRSERDDLVDVADDGNYLDHDEQPKDRVGDRQ